MGPVKIVAEVELGFMPALSGLWSPNLYGEGKNGGGIEF